MTQAAEPSTEPAVGRWRWWRRRRWVLARVVVTLVVAAMAVGMVLGPRLTSPEQAVADAAPPPASLVTATVEQRTLVESVVMRGTVEPGASIKVTVPSGLEGQLSVVTAVPARRGTRLAEGSVLVEVAGAPVFGLVLPFPLYRDITDGMFGPDVREVQKALTRLGHHTVVDGTFGADTQDALRGFYAARGYQVPEAGSTGQLAPEDEPAGQEPPAGLAATPTLPRTHVVRLDRPGRTISAVPVRVGAVLTEPAALLAELDAGATTISALATQRQVALLGRGTAAEVVDDVRGLTTTAAVVTIGTEPVQADVGTGFRIRFAFTGTALPPSPNHTVRVTVGAASGAEPVLAAPVTAVYSNPDGTTFVTVVDGRDRTTDVPVRTGTTAGGWIEITPLAGPVEPGSQVLVGADFRQPTAGG